MLFEATSKPNDLEGNQPAMPRPKLLIATRNPGKMREYRQLLREVPFELVSLDDLGITDDVEETESTFAENAALKVQTYSALAGLLTLADDSGLEVDALGGAPGVLSARYGGDTCCTDDDRVDLLLRNLEDVSWHRRTARFRCVLAVATPTDSPLLRHTQSSPPSPRAGTEGLTLLVGSVAGMIQYQPAGEEGFGYDPVFYLPSYGLTMAQLPLEEKNRVSHRANAVGKAVKKLSAISLQPCAT